MGQTAACPLGHSGRHCLTLFLVFSSVCAFFRFFIIIFFYYKKKKKMCACVCVGVRTYVRLFVRAEGGKEKYVWADLPSFCGSLVYAGCLPRVHNDY